MVEATVNIPGYRVLEQIYTGTRTLVYRGLRKQDQQHVVIKLMRNEYPSFNELVQFRNQYTIAKNLDIPGIVQPLSLETRQSLCFGNGRLWGYLSSGMDEAKHRFCRRISRHRYSNHPDSRKTTSRSHYS